MGSGLWSSPVGLVACLCCLGLAPARGGKVLVLPVDGSHWLSLKLLVEELAVRGHDVLALVPESSLLLQGPGKFKTEAYQVSFTQAELDQSFQSLSDSVFRKAPDATDMYDNVQRLVNFTSFQEKACESLLTNEPLMTQLRKRGFDVVLTDPFLPCGSILSHILSIPAVYFLRGLPCRLDLKANLCPSPPSFVPVSFSGNTDVMTFPERLKNALMSHAESHMCTLLYGHFDILVRKYTKDISTYKELISHGSIWLLRYDFTLEYPRPLMPNMVLIGGINCEETAPLPPELQEFVEGSGDDGFIVFALGSMISTMPEPKAKQFFDAFRQIPQRVVWRYTGVVPDDIPKNVKVMKWLPQGDLLAHPKAKLLMTHGGTHSIYDAICNRVPMLMFPLFADQSDNVDRMVHRGVGEELCLFDVTTESLLAALKKMTNNPSYKAKLTTLSEIHQDRQLSPLDLAAFWTEFVIRHKGASHLRVAGHNLNWIQYHNLDVFGFLIAVLLFVLWLQVKFCLFCMHKCGIKRSTKTKSE